ncbi:MAG: class I SAM-dependent methyltransferase [Anaerolineales bacterium]
MTLHWQDTFPAEAKETVPCPLCGAADYRTLVTEWSLGVVKCQHCGLIYTNPRLKESHKNYWYDDDAADAEARFLDKYGAVFRGERPHDRDPHYQAHLAEIARVKPSGAFLDVGAHCGFLMRLGTDRWDMVGVEPSPLFARFAQEYFGLDVRAGLLEEVDLPPRHFDVVAMTDVLEHVGDPGPLLEQVRAVLKPDGLLYIKVPHGDWNRVKQAVLVGLLRSQRFDIWDSREHVVFYTQKTLRAMLEKHGYRVRRIGIAQPINAGGGVHPLRQTAWALSMGMYRATGGWVSPFAASLIAEAHPSL